MLPSLFLSWSAKDLSAPGINDARTLEYQMCEGVYRILLLCRGCWWGWGGGISGLAEQLLTKQKKKLSSI
jgi:hypothetical protein